MSTAQDHGSRASTNRAAASAAPQLRCACRGVAASKADVLTRCKLKGVSHSWRAGARRVLCARVPAEFHRPARRALPEGGWGVPSHGGRSCWTIGTGRRRRHVWAACMRPRAERRRRRRRPPPGSRRGAGTGACMYAARACMQRGRVCGGMRRRHGRQERRRCAFVLRHHPTRRAGVVARLAAQRLRLSTERGL